ncbi:MAG: TlpA disulfide reductase family protein [Bacteroidota bacterium]
MKNLKIIFLILIAVFLSCEKQKNNSEYLSYSLVGIVNNWPDGTNLYLLDLLSTEIVDSSIVENSSFAFNGYLHESPQKMALHKKDFSESKIIWIENGDMVLDAAKTSLRGGKMKGSRTQFEAEILFSQLDSLEDYEAEIEASMDFIAKFPNSRVSAEILSGYSQNIGKAKVSKLFNQLSEANKQSIYGQRIVQYLRLNKSHLVGDKYSDFEMNSANDNAIKFSESMGQITLLEFWASWCGPCRRENPELVKIYKKYEEKGFQVFSVSLDFSKEDWLQAINEDGLTWKHVSDLKGRNSTAGIIYGVNKIPDNFLIDADGKIAGRGLWGKELINAIDDLLANEIK